MGKTVRRRKREVVKGLEKKRKTKRVHNRERNRGVIN